MGPHASSKRDGERVADLEREAGEHVIPMSYNCPTPLITPPVHETPRLALQARPQFTPLDLHNPTGHSSNTYDDPPEEMLPPSDKWGS